MVSFSCEACGDVLTKKKLDNHRNQCHGASYTCLDCMVHFMGTDYRSHTSCISEAQKYQGALYRPEKEKKGKGNAGNASQKAYVEDAEDEYSGDFSTALTIVEALPEAPSPPSAAPGFRASPTDPVNVFDFWVGNETPNQSTLNLAATEKRRMIEASPAPAGNGDRKGVWFEEEIVQEDVLEDGTLVQYGSGPVPTGNYQTPAPKADRERKKIKDRDPTKEEKKDKKRKRLHVDTSAERSRSREIDEEMTDAPPVLHSGLTGGLKGLLSRPSTFPPSPDYSGDNAGEPSPGSPLKRSKHSKRGRDSSRRENALSNGFMSLITSRRSKKTTNTDPDRVRKHKRRARDDSDRPTPKLLEYKPLNGSADANDQQQLILYREQARAELFMSFVSKGPESEKGCSMNKTLKRYHRERTALGVGHGKGHEEKELWRSLRLKRNDRGEIVLFCPGLDL